MKLLTREQFRESVFERDHHKCVICGATSDLAAHHIMERRLWSDGGYYTENGASLCPSCHIRAEETTLSCEEIRAACGITTVALPEHLYADFIYDKWSNIRLANGTCLPGELFWDESVQKILKQGNVLQFFVPYVKHPRTHHLPWSNPSSDDKIMEDLSGFLGEEVVVSVKLDGEQSNFYRDHYHARSLESATGEDRSFARALHSQIAHDIPEGWRVCGENLYAHHSIYYHSQNAYPPYFKVFGIWNERNECLSWTDTCEWAALLGLEMVPLLYRGPWNAEKVKSLWQPEYKGDPMEGYVVRVARQFAYGEFKHVVAKYVRPDFVPGHARHWRQGPGVYNGQPMHPHDESYAPHPTGYHIMTEEQAEAFDRMMAAPPRPPTEAEKEAVRMFNRTVTREKRNG